MMEEASFVNQEMRIVVNESISKKLSHMVLHQPRLYKKGVTCFKITHEQFIQCRKLISFAVSNGYGNPT